MSASASDRRRLQLRLEQLLGPEDAATLMEQLPPSEWHNPATRADITELRAELRGELREFRHEVSDLRKEQRDATRILFFSMLTSQATLVGMVLAAVQLG